MDAEMNERLFRGEADQLRAPARVEALDVTHVVDLCLSSLDSHSVLDVGTGTGLFAEGFAARGLRVGGVDISHEMVVNARKRVPLAEFREGRAEALPYAKAAFDLVFFGVVLHETSDPLQALKEARRVSRRRVAVLEWPYREQPVGPPLAERLRPEQTEALAREAGFASVETHALEQVTLYLLS